MMKTIIVTRAQKKMEEREAITAFIVAKLPLFDRSNSEKFLVWNHLISTTCSVCYIEEHL